MGTLTDIVIEEKERLEGLLEYYYEELKKYPKGSISRKKRSGHYYYYQCYRSGTTVITIYVGKENSDEVENVRKRVEKRHELEKKIRRAKENLKEAKGLLRGK